MSELLTTRDVPTAELVAGSHRPLGAVSIDSRSAPPGSTFFCIPGPRFDGHTFAEAAVRAGARAIVASAHGLERLPAHIRAGDITVLRVPDTGTALGLTAAAARARFGGPVVAVTGSSGKTTTKELIAAVMRVTSETLATEGNLNNHLGLPLTLLRLAPAHRVAVVEMGMSDFGEIATLSAIARPQIGVLTTIGYAHTRALPSLDDVARAKGELFAALPHNGIAIFPSSLPRPWIATRHLRAATCLVGERPEDEIRLVGPREMANGARADVIFADGTRHRLRLAMAGRHNLYNALLALAVGRALDVPVEPALEALAAVPPPPMRGEVRALPDGSRVVLDCYNANPQSMRAAIDAFERRARQGGILVLGDMLELGDIEVEAHRDIGRRVAAMPGARVVGVGPLCRHLVDAAREAGLDRRRAVCVASAEDAVDAVASLRRRGLPILLKGSRGMRLERVWSAMAGASDGEEA